MQTTPPNHKKRIFSLWKYSYFCAQKSMRHISCNLRTWAEGICGVSFKEVSTGILNSTWSFPILHYLSLGTIQPIRLWNYISSNFFQKDDKVRGLRDYVSSWNDIFKDWILFIFRLERIYVEKILHKMSLLYVLLILDTSFWGFMVIIFCYNLPFIILYVYAMRPGSAEAHMSNKLLYLCRMSTIENSTALVISYACFP